MPTGDSLPIPTHWPATQFVLPARLVQQLQKLASSHLPIECCGFLAGTIDHQRVTVTQVYPITNEQASPTAFRTAPKDVLAAFRAMRQQNQELVAIYHSHPTSAPIPSQRDLQENTYGLIPWLILGRTRADDWELRTWTLHDSTFEPIPLIVMEVTEE